MPENTNHPSSEGTFLTSTPDQPPICRWIKAKRRVALAVNPDDDTALEKWQAGGSARRTTMMVATKGVHSGIEDFKAAINAARVAIGHLAKLAS